MSKTQALAVLGAFVLLAPVPAGAIDVPPGDQARLDEAASWMANRPVIVRCLEHADPESPYSIGTWAYVRIDGNVIYMDALLCRGQVALLHRNVRVAAWLRAFSALVLTHEAFHLRLSMDNRGNEAATECRAIRHAAYMLAHLGATPTQVRNLMPYAIAAHYRQAVLYPDYSRKDCKVPWYW